MIAPTDRVALLMESAMREGTGKMGLGILRYAEYPVVCALDSQNLGGDLGSLSGIPRSCPIVSDIGSAAALGANVLVLGIAPPGGQLPPEWEPTIRAAFAAGMSIVNGLHAPLAPVYRDPSPGQWIWDIRQEPEGLQPGTGAARLMSNRRVLFVGTNMSVGKMTAGLEVLAAARRNRVCCGFVATGQTGMAITGSGIPLDAVRLDFATGAVEREVLAHGEDVVLIEGQGSLIHPGSCATLPLMRGSMPTHLVLCHEAGMSTLPRHPWVTIPNLSAFASLCSDLAGANDAFPSPEVVAVCLNTAAYEDEGARLEIEKAVSETGLPTTDPVRYGGDAVLNAILR